MSKPQTPPVKFLLVDDRDENLIALEALLRRDGLEIFKARTGDEALEILLAHDIALAILDVQMPEMDGFALAELMRGSERSRHVPIIFVTAAVQEHHRVFQGYDAGAVDFLFKPIEARILRHKAAVFFDLYKQRQELAETLRVTETFIAAIGHDLKSPIHSIVMATDLILRRPQEDATKGYAERIRSSSRRMVGMIDDLFDLARVRLGEGIPLERTRVDLLAVVRAVVAECLAAAPGRTIEISHEGDTSGSWDAGRVGQVVSNLVSNALRHGNPDAPVTVAVQGVEAGHVSLTVHNGGAIPPEVRETIFDPFRSGHSTRGRKVGLGLGLFIVAQLASAHGGTVEVESSVEEGTTFRVRLARG
jgi:two-component system, sensor histidine kinase and response regulator